MGAQHGWDSRQVDIDRLQHDIHLSERAEHEGRVVNRDRWLASLNWRRLQLRWMQDELVGREEAQAELDHGSTP